MILMFTHWITLVWMRHTTDHLLQQPYLNFIIKHKLSSMCVLVGVHEQRVLVRRREIGRMSKVPGIFSNQDHASAP